MSNYFICMECCAFNSRSSGYLSVPDPDLEIRGWGGGKGDGEVWAKNKGGGATTLGPSPGSPTAFIKGKPRGGGCRSLASYLFSSF